MKTISMLLLPITLETPGRGGLDAQYRHCFVLPLQPVWGDARRGGTSKRRGQNGVTDVTNAAPFESIADAVGGVGVGADHGKTDFLWTAHAE
jgi:hypothetical protein